MGSIISSSNQKLLDSNPEFWEVSYYLVDKPFQIGSNGFELGTNDLPTEVPTYVIPVWESTYVTEIPRNSSFSKRLLNGMNDHDRSSIISATTSVSYEGSPPDSGILMTESNDEVVDKGKHKDSYDEYDDSIEAVLKANLTLNETVDNPPSYNELSNSESSTPRFVEILDSSVNQENCSVINSLHAINARQGYPNGKRKDSWDTTWDKQDEEQSHFILTQKQEASQDDMDVFDGKCCNTSEDTEISDPSKYIDFHQEDHIHNEDEAMFTDENVESSNNGTNVSFPANKREEEHEKTPIETDSETLSELTLKDTHEAELIAMEGSDSEIASDLESNSNKESDCKDLLFKDVKDDKELENEYENNGCVPSTLEDSSLDVTKIDIEERNIEQPSDPESHDKMFSPEYTSYYEMTLEHSSGGGVDDPVTEDKESNIPNILTESGHDAQGHSSARLDTSSKKDSGNVLNEAVYIKASDINNSTFVPKNTENTSLTSNNEIMEPRYVIPKRVDVFSKLVGVDHTSLRTSYEGNSVITHEVNMLEGQRREKKTESESYFADFENSYEKGKKLTTSVTNNDLLGTDTDPPKYESIISDRGHKGYKKSTSFKNSNSTSLTDNYPKNSLGNIVIIENASAPLNAQSPSSKQKAENSRLRSGAVNYSYNYEKEKSPKKIARVKLLK